MKKTFSMFAILFSIFFVAKPAYAIFIVDTGEGSEVMSYGLNDLGVYAFQFALDKDYVISDIEFWIRSSRSDRLLTGEISILNNLGGLPGSDIYLRGTRLFQSGPYAWQGLNDLDQYIERGTYWVALASITPLAPLPTGGFVRVSASLQANSPNPLTEAAFLFENEPWQSADHVIDVGIRIQGGMAQQSNVVPEPASILLFGLGSIGAFVRRKFSS